MSSFEESRFRQQVDKALTQVKTILATNRDPQYASDVPHQYGDKFSLANYLTNGALAAQMNILEQLGLQTESLGALLEWARKRSVTLRLKAEEKCTYLREATRKVESSTEYVTEVSSSLFGKSTRTDKTVTTITEYFWKFDFEYELFAYRGNKPQDEESRIVLQGRKGSIELKTTSKSSPRPEIHIEPSIDVNITWMLQQINRDNLQLKFAIDRKLDSCRTPRRNTQIEAALSFFSQFSDWAARVNSYFLNKLFPVYTEHGLDLRSINCASIFVPVVPLFEEGVHGKVASARKEKEARKSKKSPRGEKASEDKASSSSSSSNTLTVPGAGSSGVSSAISIPETGSDALTCPVLPASDVDSFLAEQKRSLVEKFGELDKIFPAAAPAKLISSKEANMLVLVQHAREITQQFFDGINYIEDMLRKQLVAAIGKEVGPIDFANYMKFHQRKLYRGEYEPVLFSQAVRRPDHYPEGTVTIEAQQHDGTIADPIYTSVRRIPAEQAAPMRFPINAATDVVFGGDRFLHAYIQHAFEGATGSSLSLVARARQFSSFIMLVGRIASADVFEPKGAIIIQNKDELTIPLMLEQIPTPKEFRDAIESMSPEQQRFCKAYRAMQLESTLFGICIIQIKPQLEKLLNLPYDSLTKEIRLTQDLLELFMKYQIPSDQLSFDPTDDVLPGPTTAVDAVKRHVKNMQSMLEDSKKQELQQASSTASYSLLDDISSSSSSRPMQQQQVYLRSEMALGGGGGGASFGSASVSGGAPGGSRRMTGAVAMPVSAPVGSTGSTTITTKTSTAASVVEATPQPIGVVDVSSGISEVVGEDFTKIPAELDRKFEKLDVDSALRPTIIHPGKYWTKKYYKALLQKEPTVEQLDTNKQGEERNRAYDLLDALSRSGALSIECAELHVVIAATHCFDKSLMDTVIQDNVNPIEKVERSSLIVATTVHNKTALELIKSDQSDRVQTYSPMLFDSAAKPAITN